MPGMRFTATLFILFSKTAEESGISYFSCVIDRFFLPKLNIQKLSVIYIFHLYNSVFTVYQNCIPL